MIGYKKKKWLIKEKPKDSDLIKEIASSLGVSETFSALLINRGYTDTRSALAFLNKSQEKLHDPFLLNDMDKAVYRIISAVNSKEKITIYGDYDVDGITSVCNLLTYLKSKGATVDYYIPCRKTEGYGVSKDAVKKLAENGTRLIITVDTGVGAIDEIDFARESGIDVVVTDHHECNEKLPNAVAVVNPKRQDSTYPFPSLAGVGVAFKLLCALESTIEKIGILEATKRIAYDYADLTAIGTIADVMPVIDENRIITAYGLDRVEKTEKIGLEALIRLCRSGETKSNKPKSKKKINSAFVGYSLAPRINATGRISSASIAVDLLLTKDENKAEEYASEICEINRERQFTENKIAEEALKIAEESGCEGKSIVILDNICWNHGVIGIVASKVAEKYGVPAILISFEGNDDPFDDEAVGKGSGRSIPGLNLFEALSTCDDILEKAGGHELAAGLSVKRKNLPFLRDRLEAYASECFKKKSIQRTLEIDAELTTNDMSLGFAEELALLEPCGTENQVPVFATKSMVIENIMPISMNRHLKLTLSKEGQYYTAMLFSMSPDEFLFNEGDEVDIAYNLEINEYLGNISIVLNVRDICESSRSVLIENQNEALYQEAKEGISKLSYEYIVPEREDCAVVYNCLSQKARCGQDIYTYTKLTSDLSQSIKSRSFNYVKVKLIIKIFRELNIISIDEIDERSFSFKLIYGKAKTNLDKSNILKRLRSIYKK